MSAEACRPLTQHERIVIEVLGADTNISAKIIIGKGSFSPISVASKKDLGKNEGEHNKFTGNLFGQLTEGGIHPSQVKVVWAYISEEDGFFRSRKVFHNSVVTIENRSSDGAILLGAVRMAIYSSEKAMDAALRKDRKDELNAKWSGSEKVFKSYHGA